MAIHSLILGTAFSLTLSQNTLERAFHECFYLAVSGFLLEMSSDLFLDATIKRVPVSLLGKIIQFKNPSSIGFNKTRKSN